MEPHAVLHEHGYDMCRFDSAAEARDHYIAVAAAGGGSLPKDVEAAFSAFRVQRARPIPEKSRMKIGVGDGPRVEAAAPRL